MRYPDVYSEDETLDRALDGMPIARFGDGELSLALGGDCIFQDRNAVLSRELRKMLQRPRHNLLICIPNIEAPTKRSWKKYGEQRFRGLYTDGPYGSAFITRPDSAPWIDRPDYWEKMRGLWRGKDVVLVKGTEVSLRESQLDDARSVRVVTGPGKNAFTDIDRIDWEIGTPTGPVILCLGPTATILAWRLSRRNVRGIDLGHVGLYMRHVGAYAIKPEDLASPAYVEQLRDLHARQKWGHHGASHAPEILAFAHSQGMQTVLDYGCGEGTLARAVPTLKVQTYDPGVPHKDGIAKPADLIVATDVLEHVEPDKLNAVLRHIWLLAGKGAFLSISCQPARELLPDGRNAHLSIHTPECWLEKLETYGWGLYRFDYHKGLRAWLTK